jgi:hypothetical protein
MFGWFKKKKKIEDYSLNAVYEKYMKSKEKYKHLDDYISREYLLFIEALKKQETK